MIFVFSGVLSLAISVALLLRSAVTRLEQRPVRWLIPFIVAWCVLGALTLYATLGAPLIVPLLAS